MFPNVRPNTTSSRTTPLSSTSAPSNPPPKSTTLDKDSFANLVSFASSNSNKSLSLLEQQRRLQEEKARKEAENRSRLESQYGGQNSQFWDNLEKGGSRQPIGFGTMSSVNAPSPDEDDILAAFDASAPVDASTHFPVPSLTPSPQVGSSPSQAPSNGAASAPPTSDMSFLDDDDLFGLNQLKPKSAPALQPAQTNEDDDFLGLLGKPVSEIPKPGLPVKPSTPPMRESPPAKASNGVDRAVAELVDMGFPADKSAQALQMTSSGTDVQAAVGLLLSQAHEESRERPKNRLTAGDLYPDHTGRNRDWSERSDRNVPSWMQQERASTSRNRSSNRSPLSADKDPAQVASVFGNNLLKTANSLWKSGSKKVQQVVNDFNTEQDSSQPKWLREASMREREQSFSGDRHQVPGKAHQQPAALTDEALLLESGGDLRSSRKSERSNDARPPSRTASDGFRNQPSSAGDRRMQPPAFMREQARSETRDPRSRVSKTTVEQQSVQAYVSPARRKRPVAQSPAPEPNVDLFESSSPSFADQRPKPSSSPGQSSRPSTPSKPLKSLPVRPKAPPRVVPPLSQEALLSTHRHREKGTESYKRGDYASAHNSFTKALGMLPEKHPITVIIRSNRAMTALKIGEPKVAISDADTILEVIGPSKGEAESIELGNGEPNKPMRDFFGKALMRRAEALEQLERWADAAQSWKQAVENGHGGSTSIQGRNRCEKAAGISKPTPKRSASSRRPPTPATKKPSALEGLQGGSSSSGMDSTAVSRLRAANQAAELADEEKFALTESVNAHLDAWKNGKQDNLRALLASLDTVLWPEAGWKKINMSELIMPGKVKVHYMKGIAKVHPDKISTGATTEQRMIAGAVFGALNEAWDKFKQENNL
ncbi:hypothetical protein EYZ11_000133 [Aspergillus tanneri]|nr:hypothetical protein EYZ11_000133 [Aspergillus tanneri]